MVQRVKALALSCSSLDHCYGPGLNPEWELPHAEVMAKKKKKEVPMLCSLILVLFFPRGNHYHEFGIYSVHAFTFLYVHIY